MSDRNQNVYLGNWREAPQNRWSLHHVRELIPTANIPNQPDQICALRRTTSDLDGLHFIDGNGYQRSLATILTEAWTDALCVLHKGSIVYEWYAPHYSGTDPHILFSVSKSVTGALAGVLVEQGRLAVGEQISTYIPDAAGAAYGDCTVQHLLDMQVGLNFSEIYTGENAQFNRYRVATGWNLPTPGEAAGDLRNFLITLGHSGTPHGHAFQYMSPNTDMLGLILEAASGKCLSELLSKHIWRPMGAESDAYITVDARGAPRAAGGICVLPRDLARFGQVMCGGGRFNDRQIIPEHWVEDCRSGGSRDAWQRGSMSDLLPNGKYRNQWYQTGNPAGAFCAIGIHGQWIYVDPAAEVVIVKVSSQPEPVDDALDTLLLQFYGSIVNALN